MIDTVIVPVANRYDLLDRCVASLGSVQTLIVIDNGNGSDRLDDVPNVRTMYQWRMPSNLGVASSWNLGIKATPFSSGWLLLNSDAFFMDDAWSVLDAEARSNNLVLAGDPPWCCAWIGADIVRNVGLFCERFHPAYFEDNDYEDRVRIHGYEIVRSRARIGHDNSSTLAADARFQQRNALTFAANQAYYRRRWTELAADGLPRDAEWSLRTRLANSWDEP